MSDQPSASQSRVRLDVTCINDHLIATYYDRIEEKYTSEPHGAAM